MKFLTPEEAGNLSYEEKHSLALSNRDGKPSPFSEKFAEFKTKKLLIFCYLNWGEESKDTVYYLDYPEYYEKLKDPMDKRQNSKELKALYLELAKIYVDHFQLGVNLKHSKKENINKLIDYEKKAMLVIFTN